MKHFLIEIIYTAPLEKIEELTLEHRAFLQTGYKMGMLLLSGPQVPRSGGIVIGKSESLDSIRDFFKRDPYSLNGAAEYRFVEFSPKSHQSFLADWLKD